MGVPRARPGGAMYSTGMTNLTAPLRFEPFLRPVVWGGRRLETVLDKRLPTADSYGESWEISDHPSHRTLLATAPGCGMSLRDLMVRHRNELLGPAASRCETFPWLIKFLDARDWLSVQVHPDDAGARTLCPGEGGKTEAWFILDASAGARIWAGLKPGVTPDDLRRSLFDGTVVDRLHSFAPKAGQCVFLPAGTVHAVGGGVLMAEIQQTSDATFRLFDWNRVDDQGKPRALHIEQALAAIDWSRGPVEPMAVTDGPWDGAPAGPLPDQAQCLVACRFFNVAYLQGTKPIVLGGEGVLQAAIVLYGAGHFGADQACGKGETWVIPAAAAPIALKPGAGGMALLLVRLPE